eukprot:scaffold17869_cov104-Isochrysis_galbana.AAC.8
MCSQKWARPCHWCGLDIEPTCAGDKDTRGRLGAEGAKVDRTKENRAPLNSVGAASRSDWRRARRARAPEHSSPRPPCRRRGPMLAGHACRWRGPGRGRLVDPALQTQRRIFARRSSWSRLGPLPAAAALPLRAPEGPDA